MSLGFYQPEDTEDPIRFITKGIVHILVIIVLAIFLVEYMGMSYEVIGHSMEPDFQLGDTVLVDRITYKVRKPHRFEVLLFKNGGDEEHIYMKRVIGIPGETVQIRGGKIFIDGQELDIGNFDALTGINLAGVAEEPVLLGKGEYFVMGDNSDSSEDSRFANIGNVKAEYIIGKIWLRSKPFDRAGLIRHEQAETEEESSSEAAE